MDQLLCSTNEKWVAWCRCTVSFCGLATVSIHGKNLKETRVITGPHYLMSATIFREQTLIGNGTDLLCGTLVARPLRPPLPPRSPLSVCCSLATRTHAHAHTHRNTLCVTWAVAWCDDAAAGTEITLWYHTAIRLQHNGARVFTHRRITAQLWRTVSGFFAQGTGETQFKCLIQTILN